MPAPGRAAARGEAACAQLCRRRGRPRLLRHRRIRCPSSARRQSRTPHARPRRHWRRGRPCPAASALACSWSRRARGPRRRRAPAPPGDMASGAQLSPPLVVVERRTSSRQPACPQRSSPHPPEEACRPQRLGHGPLALPRECK
jgi:hypothetical protein